MGAVVNKAVNRITKDREFAKDARVSATWVLENVSEGDHIIVYQNDRKMASEVCVVTDVHSTGTVSARSVGGNRDYQALVHVTNPKLKMDEFVKKNHSFDHTPEHKSIADTRSIAVEAKKLLKELRSLSPSDTKNVASINERLDGLELKLSALTRDLQEISKTLADQKSKK